MPDVGIVRSVQSQALAKTLRLAHRHPRLATRVLPISQLSKATSLVINKFYFILQNKIVKL